MGTMVIWSSLCLYFYKEISLYVYMLHICIECAKIIELDVDI